jgi:hypothetical protein
LFSDTGAVLFFDSGWVAFSELPSCFSATGLGLVFLLCEPAVLWPVTSSEWLLLLLVPVCFVTLACISTFEPDLVMSAFASEWL